MLYSYHLLNLIREGSYELLTGIARFVLFLHLTNHLVLCKGQVEGEIATSLLSIVEALSRFNFHALHLHSTVGGRA